MNKIEKMIQAWREAGNDLGLEVVSPFIYEGQEYLLLVRSFGRKKGTIIQSLEYNVQLENLEYDEYYSSALNIDGYSEYGREKFIDTLEDWGYWGPEEERPGWYEHKYYGGL